MRYSGKQKLAQPPANAAQQGGSGRRITAVMGNLDKCRRKMLPVVANHRLLRWRFDIPGEQDTVLAVINTHHA